MVIVIDDTSMHNVKKQKQKTSVDFHQNFGIFTEQFWDECDFVSQP